VFVFLPTDQLTLASQTLRVLVLDRDYINALTHAIQLSGYGFIVETVQDMNEAACRLSTMMSDAILCSLDVNGDVQRETLFRFQQAYPSTEFYTQERFGSFSDESDLKNPSEGGDRIAS